MPMWLLLLVNPFHNFQIHSFDQPGEVVNHLILEPGEVPPDVGGQHHQVVVHQQSNINKEPIVFLQVNATSFMQHNSPIYAE